MILLFKSFLLLCVASFIYLVVFRLRTVLIQRILIIPLVIVLCVFTVTPESSTRVANVFGIGRGADLIFYLAHLTEAFLLLILYARYQNISRDLEEMVRREALDRARPPMPLQ